MSKRAEFPHGLALVCFWAVGSSMVFSDVPRLIHYQGKLRQSGGAAVSGAFSIVFRLYDQPTAGTELFEETHTDVPVTGGLFDVLIGSSGGVSDAALSAEELWLGVTIGGGPELSPRTRIGSGAHAIKARSAEQLVKPGTFDPAVSVDAAGLVGIGTTNPGAKLHVAGMVRIADGTEGADKVLTSDASGNATWQSSGGTFTNYATLARGHASSNELQQNQADGLYRFQNDQFAYVVLKGVLPGDYDSGDVTVQAWFYIHDDNNTRKMTRYLSASYPSGGGWTATTYENGVNFDITNNSLLTLTIPAAQVVPGGVVRLTMVRNGSDGGDNGGRLDFYAARLMYTARR